MLQVMDNMEVYYVFYVKVSTFTHFKQSKISRLTVNKSAIVTLTVQHDMIVSLQFHVISRGLFEINISRRPFPRTTSY
jgi:hypothetical protein